MPCMTILYLYRPMLFLWDYRCFSDACISSVRACVQSGTPAEANDQPACKDFKARYQPASQTSMLSHSDTLHLQMQSSFALTEPSADFAGSLWAALGQGSFGPGHARKSSFVGSGSARLAACLIRRVQFGPLGYKMCWEEVRPSHRGTGPWAL